MNSIDYPGTCIRCGWDCDTGRDVCDGCLRKTPTFPTPRNVDEALLVGMARAIDCVLPQGSFFTRRPMKGRDA